MRRFAAAPLLATLGIAFVVMPTTPAAAAVRAPRFGAPVFVSDSPETQGAEPSIRVDATDPNGRIWIAAPTGIGVSTRPLADSGGDLFWYSDDRGRTWNIAGAVGGVSSPTIVGGGDSDIATGYGDQVYGTGLTLANITLAASCDNGQTFTTNPVSNPDTAEDRQWIDTWEDHPKPADAPDLLLTYGNFGTQRIEFHQVVSPECAPPVAGPPIDVTHPQCSATAPVEGDPQCYQWPGNLAVDETRGDVYVTYNTVGKNCGHDNVIVTRVDGGASRVATQADVHPFIAARHRGDTFDSFTVVAVDNAGNVYVVWSERDHHMVKSGMGRTDVFYAYSKDRGEHWSDAIRVNSVPNTTTFPWIVAGDAGRIDIVYYGTLAYGRSPETVPNNSLWQVYMAQSLNATSATPTFREVVASPAMHRGSICTSGTGCDPGTRDLADFFQVDIDARGMANITYTDNLNTPAPPSGTDPHQEWVTFVRQNGGASLLAP